MTFFYTILFLQAFGILCLLGITVYTCLQRPSKMQVQMLMISITTILMLVGYIIEMLAARLPNTSNPVEFALIGVFISYIGKPFALLSTLAFMADYCGKPMSNKLFIALAVFSASFVGVVGTNQFTHIYYATVSYDPDGLFSPLVLTHGFYYYLYMAYIFGYMIACIVLAVKKYKAATTKAGKRQVLYLIAMIASAILGYCFFLSGITMGYDSTMAGCVISTFILIMLFTRYRLFDALTLAKDRALDDASTGLLVFDPEDKLIYRNTVLKGLLDKTFTSDELLQLDATDNLILKNESVYNIQKRPIIENQRSYGTMIEVSDITDSYNYSARLERDVEERTSEVLHIQRSIIGSLANVVEARNGETGSHIKRTSAYVKILAQDLQRNGYYPDILTKKYIDTLVDVSPLHDIGKINISDTILLKPGKLNDEEFNIMKTHSKLGADIIRDIMSGIETDEYVALATEVALCHHEKWNGSGYPNGLAGKDIPLAARIMAIADVYDALRSERCYKKAMDKETALNIIKESSGSHFDPEVVEAFLRSLQAIEAVK